jgi:thioredoxin reductase (NADPH)
MEKSENHYDVIVIGAGAAGLTAGIYLSRARLKTLILEQNMVGGQMVLTHEIANYPGVESISGYGLSSIMKKQALSFGCKIKSGYGIQEMQLEETVKSVVLTNGEQYTADAVILASGGRSRTLGAVNEEQFKGSGISYCATCDGDFFTDKEIILVGGGNSALEEAVSLTKYASKVTIVHQFDHFQAFDYYVEEAKNHPKIDFIMESTIQAYHGTEKLESVELKNLKTGDVTIMPIDGVFVFVGYIPNTEFLKGQKVKMNDRQEIVVDTTMQTNIPGVFAAGDANEKKYRQVSIAVGEGTIAALSASQYVHQLNKKL